MTRKCTTLTGRAVGMVAGIVLLGVVSIEPAMAQQLDPSGGGQSLGALWNSYQTFVVLIVLLFTFIGALSKSLAVASWSGYLAFIYLALSSENEIFRGIALVTLVLTFLGMAFKLIRLELDADR